MKSRWSETPGADTPTPEWLVGGGEMGDLIRRRDWSRTSFGPRELWSASLRTAVSIVLGSQFPMALLWGRDLLLLYNDAYRELAGEKHPAALGRSTREAWAEVWHINEPIFAAVMDRGETTFLEDKLFRIDRHGRREDAYFTLCYGPVRGQDGRIEGSLVTLLETTRRVQAQREQEQRLRLMFENVALGVAEVGIDGRVQMVNRRLGTLLGYEPDQLVGMSIHELTAPEDRDRSRELNGRVLRGELDSFVYEKRYLKKDGAPVWVRVTVSAICDVGGAVRGAVGTVEDITERKRVEEELARERTLLQGVFDNIPVLLVLWDPRLKRFTLNRAAEEVLGWTTADANEGDLMAKVYPDPDYRGQATAFMKSLQPGFREWFVTTKGGDRIPTEWANVHLRDDTAIGIGVDVRERRQAEEEKRDAFDRYERQVRLFDAIASTTPDFVYLFDREGRFQYANRRLLEVWGMRLEDAVGKTCRELGYEQWHHDMHMREIAQVKATKQPIKGEVPFQAPRTGIFGIYEYIFTPVIGPDGEVELVAGTTRDVTDRKRAEEALRRSEREYRSLAENAPEVIARFDREMKHVYVNEYGAKVYGVPRESVIGKSSAQLGMPADRVALWQEHFDAVLSSGRQQTVDFELESPTYGHQYFSSLWVPERDERGDVVSVLAITRDVTSLRSAEEALRRSQSWLEAERARLQTIVETIPTGLFILEANGRASLINEEAKRIWAGTGRLESLADFVEYKAFWPDSGQRLAAEDWPAAQALQHGRTVKAVILDIERFDGTRGTIVASGAPIRDETGQVVGSVAANQEITELRQAQARLEEADRRKNEFLAVLSHELRNPLAPIRNSLYILERAVPGGQQAKRAHQVIDRQVVHMTRLVDDLLDVTRISRGKVRLQRERVELCDVVARTAEDHRSLFKAAEIQLETRICGGPLHTEGDVTRLSQIIGNLLTNAAKFTPRGGRVELWVEPEHGAAAIHVRDSGAGIAQSLLPKLFQPFVQADATLDRSKGGLGLGLALVKGLVELHGGTVSVRSEGPGRGAEFVVQLPLQERSARTHQQTALSSTISHKKRLRVLLIEDNEDAAESLKEALELNGHHVETAGSGPEGIEKARVFQPDAVLCDIGLPGIDGFEVARRMRGDPILRATCLVALSGYAGPEDLERSRAAGFVQHLAKPPDLGVLELTLYEACEGAAQRPA